jgi:hypothetical protein
MLPTCGAVSINAVAGLSSTSASGVPDPTGIGAQVLRNRCPSAPESVPKWFRNARPGHVGTGARVRPEYAEGDLGEAVTQLKERTPQGVLVGSPMLSAALERLGLFDEYHLVVHPVLAGHGPSLFQGLECPRHLDLVSTTRLKSGVMAMHYRRKEG